VAVGGEVPVATTDDADHAPAADPQNAPAAIDPAGQTEQDGPLDADQIMGHASNQLLLETIVSARAVGKVRW
jgi:hypothetical protein